MSDLTRLKILLIKARQAADEGVDYIAGAGAKCPYCGRRLIVRTTRPWRDGSRVRYQYCKDVEKCLIGAAGFNVMSIEAKKS